jgi:hypothetical protein
MHRDDMAIAMRLALHRRGPSSGDPSVPVLNPF